MQPKPSLIMTCVIPHYVSTVIVFIVMIYQYVSKFQVFFKLTEQLSHASACISEVNYYFCLYYYSIIRSFQ